MKAYKAWDYKADDYSTVVFANTAKEAKKIAFHTETLENAEFPDVRVRRFPDMDNHDRGRDEIDWYDPEDRNALVALGWACSDTSYECDTCECRKICRYFEDEERSTNEYQNKS